ncbi:restriction endonuclease subunit S [Chelonobacter oris]|uniref:restriction endonuclease subunit S n=1 Tax=Chelonobacter oris TaxID=505317 RepID=UPI0024491404|nr:restriction endonuclease subunit S [Chelonobacter oris]
MDEHAPSYVWYTQQHINADLSGMVSNPSEYKTVSTFNEVCTLLEGDVVFSLISGVAAIVSEPHAGFVQTQNYIKLEPGNQLDRQFLVYLLNEDSHIKKQWAVNLQGSSILKYTLAHLKALQIKTLPPMEKQKIIGSIYMMQLRLQALKNRVAAQETKLTLGLIDGVVNHE